jgi:tRNA A37 threonylcarbamoyladenosine dehydratase
MSDYDQRFEGLRRLYGEAAYAELKSMHIAVVGIGGVGSWAVEALARSGIGTLTLIDYDTVAISNINRQIHALGSTLEQKKIAVMQARIQDINPDCRVHAVDDFLNMDNLETLLGRGYDCVIDAIDSIKFKAAMINYCRRNKIPIIATGGAGGLSDPTMIKVADLSRTHHDPLAARVRERLRDRYGFTRNRKRTFGVECVFSSQQQVYPQADGTVSHAKPGIHGISLDCRFGYGTSSCVTAPFGFVAAARAIDKVLKQRRRARDRT